MILFDEQTKIFHLKAKNTSYVIQVKDGGYLTHLYWGKKVNQYNQSNKVRYWDRGFSPNPIASDRTFSLDTLPQEYPQYGNTDFRTPAYQIQLENGSTISDLRYMSHKIVKGKPKLENLPSTYVESELEAETLEITLVDEVIHLKVKLLYTAYKDFDVITRSAQIINEGAASIKLLKAASMNVDFRHNQFELISLYGAHERERFINRTGLRYGLQSIDSRRGTSSHQQNPFLALVSEGASETSGDVYGVNLVYSGNFEASVEVDQFDCTRLTMGINHFDFAWMLESNESFQTPEVVMVYSSEGLGQMSRTFHKLYQSRLCRGKFRDESRPILINNWEATYFDFDEEKILDIAQKGKKLGMELFVLDDGWFGKRDDDNSSLGDWFVDKNKLPNGLETLVEKVRNLDMQFGLWFEPEMVSENSDLFREHPDWCIHVPNRPKSTGRNQLILDFSRKDVCDEIIARISEVLSSAPITYVKWDMNRHMTEIGSATLPPERQREVAHRYVLGLYRVMEEITMKFPDVLFESCSGGGGRFDPGMLYYMPQTWTSDNTDAISRLKIQYGTSLVYPISSMGSHVSDVPNHQLNRTTSIDIRGHVAMSGNLGYELDLTKLNGDEQRAVVDQVNYYKGIRPLVQFGDFYRLLSPFDGNETAWMFVAPNKKEAIFAHFKVLDEGNSPFINVKLQGLDPDRQYEIIELEEIYGGDELMSVGLNIPKVKGDFTSVMWRLRSSDCCY